MSKWSATPSVVVFLDDDRKKRETAQRVAVADVKSSSQDTEYRDRKREQHPHPRTIHPRDTHAHHIYALLPQKTLGVFNQTLFYTYK